MRLRAYAILSGVLAFVAALCIWQYSERIFGIGNALGKPGWAAIMVLVWAGFAFLLFRFFDLGFDDPIKATRVGLIIQALAFIALATVAQSFQAFSVAGNALAAQCVAVLDTWESEPAGVDACREFPDNLYCRDIVAVANGGQSSVDNVRARYDSALPATRDSWSAVETQAYGYGTRYVPACGAKAEACASECRGSSDADACFGKCLHPAPECLWVTVCLSGKGDDLLPLP